MAQAPTPRLTSLAGLVAALALAFQFSGLVFALLNYVLLGLGSFAVFIAFLHLVFGTSLRRSEAYVRDARNKAVLITGCDTGFGHEFARRLSQMDFTVYAGCLLPEGEGATRLAGASNITVLKLDVTSQADVDACVASVRKHLHEKGDVKLWSVVNNAGIGGMSEFEFTPLEVMQKTIDVNTLGVARVTKAFLPLLREAKEGRIVNVVSLLGRVSLPGFVAYCMSKHAAVALCDALRNELKPWNISVHSIEPGGYQTAITDESKFPVEAERYWTMADPELKAAYGRDFYDARIQSEGATLMSIVQGSHKIFEVIDDLTHAVASQFPKVRYTPHWLTKLYNVLICLLPLQLVDALVCPRVSLTPDQMKTTR